VVITSFSGNFEIGFGRLTDKFRKWEGASSSNFGGLDKEVIAGELVGF